MGLGAATVFAQGDDLSVRPLEGEIISTSRGHGIFLTAGQAGYGVICNGTGVGKNVADLEGVGHIDLPLGNVAVGCRDRGWIHRLNVSREGMLGTGRCRREIDLAAREIGQGERVTTNLVNLVFCSADNPLGGIGGGVGDNVPDLEGVAFARNRAVLEIGTTDLGGISRDGNHPVAGLLVLAHDGEGVRGILPVRRGNAPVMAGVRAVGCKQDKLVFLVVEHGNGVGLAVLKAGNGFGGIRAVIDDLVACLEMVRI